MANRLPIWHRVLVLVVVTGVSAAILVWGYVLNMGTVVVQAMPGDVVEVDSRTIPEDGVVRAGKRRVTVKREHHQPFAQEVDVVRGETVTVTPTMVFLPFRQGTRDVAASLVPPVVQAPEYQESVVRVAGYPEAPYRAELFPEGVTATLFSDDWSSVWIARSAGSTEQVRSLLDGSVLWEGATVGRTFRGGVFIAATESGDGAIRIGSLTSDGNLETIGTVEATGTATLVPHPSNESVLVIQDASGIASLLGADGRTRINLQLAAVDARWSPDGAKILFQVRTPGATPTTKLSLYDAASGTEQVIESVRAPIDLTTFLADSSALIALERVATANTSSDEVARQLADDRVRALVDELERKAITFTDFQDFLPADLNVAVELVRINLTDVSRSELLVEGAPYTSQVLRLEPGATPESITVLLPTYLEEIVLRDTAAE